MYIKAIRDLLRSKTTAAALTAIGARGGADPALATAAELRSGTVTTTRMVTPQLLAQLASTSGTTAARPTDAVVGFAYFDTTLGKVVHLKTAPSTWVDGTGTVA